MEEARRRRTKLAAFAGGAAALLLAFGSVSWACTVGGMQGEVYFCAGDSGTSAPCASPGDVRLNITGGATVYSRALALPLSNTAFKLHYVTGHSNQAFLDCMNGDNITGVLGTFTTGGTGNWKNGQVTLPDPASTTNYTQCAVYPTTGTPTHTNEHVTAGQFSVL